MTAKLCQVAFGDPTKDGATPTPQTKLSMVRTMASWRGSYDSFAARYPDIHLSETIQLGEVIPSPRLNEEPTTLRNRISRMVEGYVERVTNEQMGRQWWTWGLDSILLSNTRGVDEYLNAVGYVIGSGDGSVSLEPIQSVSIDTAAWTIPEKFIFLGGSARTLEDRYAWINDRLQAFIDGYCSGGARIPLMVNGGRESISLGKIARELSTGVYYEAWGLNSYAERDQHWTPYDAITAQMSAAFAYLDNRPRENACLVLNPLPYDWEREELIEWLRGVAVLYKVVEAKANARRVPIYWHTDRTRRNAEFDVTSMPMVWDKILEQRWQVRPPQFTPQNFAEITRKIGDKQVTLRAEIDEVTGFALARDVE